MNGSYNSLINFSYFLLQEAHTFIHVLYELDWNLFTSLRCGAGLTFSLYLPALSSASCFASSPYTSTRKAWWIAAWSPSCSACFCWPSLAIFHQAIQWEKRLVSTCKHSWVPRLWAAPCRPCEKVHNAWGAQASWRSVCRLCSRSTYPRWCTERNRSSRSFLLFWHADERTQVTWSICCKYCTDGHLSHFWWRGPNLGWQVYLFELFQPSSKCAQRSLWGQKCAYNCLQGPFN